MKTIYKTIYPFDAFNKIREGKEVFVLNRDTQKVLCLNNLSTEAALKAIDAKNENNQYEFWFEEREETRDVEII